MRLFHLTISFFIFIAGLTNVKADSPITSTPFYEVFMFEPVISEAKVCGFMSKECAAYLKDEFNSIEMKAALVNAYGWSTDGKNNANLYTRFIYNKEWKELDLNKLNASELMVLGYLVVMDNYFKPEDAIPILEKARSKDKYSYTINVILALTKAQFAMNTDFCEGWKIYDSVNSNPNLIPDMTPQAKKIIQDYMIGYKPYCK